MVKLVKGCVDLLVMVFLLGLVKIVLFNLVFFFLGKLGSVSVSVLVMMLKMLIFEGSFLMELFLGILILLMIGLLILVM